jgi:large subunit ribosomal protein L23
MNDPYRIIIRPVVTEKCVKVAQAKRPDKMPVNQYTFEVAANANKSEIKAAVEAWWKAERGIPIRVKRVNTMTVSGKWRRTTGKNSYGKTSSWKKAIVTLHDGSSMDIY